MISLVFTVPGAGHGAPDPHTRKVGTLRFELHERFGHYVLPEVALQTAPGAPQLTVRETRIGAVVFPDVEDGDLGRLVREAWGADARGYEWVVDRQEISRGARIPVDLLDRAFAAVGVRPVRAVVTWRFGFIDASGLSRDEPVDVELVFTPPGTPLHPADSRIGDLDSRRLALPAPLRAHSAGDRSFPGFAAIDLGNSSAVAVLFDTRTWRAGAIDGGQAAALRLGLAELLRADAPRELGPEWVAAIRAVCDEVAATVPGIDVRDATALAGALSTRAAPGHLGEDSLRDAVSVAFEGLLDAASGELRRWFAPRLMACYDDAFAVPAFEDHSLRVVEFRRDGRVDTEVSSAAKVTSARPMEIELGGRGFGTYRRLRTELLNPRLLPGLTGRDGRPASTDDLLAHAYLHLVRHTEDFARPDQRDPSARIDHLVITYPTTLPPRARRRLTTLIRHCLGAEDVALAYDEGTAVALFVLLREVGGRDPGLGVESFISRSRRVGEHPPRWQQHMLVLDVGAGTTDVALVQLTVTDESRTGPGQDLALHGRAYVIRPRLIASTGYPFLGGDDLTLRVFYWLKAVIVDAMISGDGSGPQRSRLRALVAEVIPDAGDARLGQLVLDRSSAERLPADLTEALHRILPTRSVVDARQVSTPEFQALWDIAEVAKIELGSELRSDYVVPHEEVLALLTALDERSGQRHAVLLPPAGIRLGADDFATLARPVLQRAASLASWLVDSTLAASDEQLDRVVLSGRGSRMPLLRRMVVDEMTGRDRAGARARLRPSVITVEHQYAKQAAAIGACWAYSLTLSGRAEPGEASLLAAGRDLVIVETGTLGGVLPWSLDQLLPGQVPRRLIKAQTELERLDDGDTVGVRSAWVPLVPRFAVHRPIDAGLSVQWSTFHLEHHARTVEGFSPDPAIWFTGASTGVMVQLEVDDRFEPTLRICQGDAHYCVPSGTAAVLSDRPGGIVDLDSLPFDLIVDDGQVVFAARPAGPDAPERRRLRFHDTDEPDSPPVAGMLSAPLPRSATGAYRLLARFPDWSGRAGEPDRLIGSFPLANRPDHIRTRYVVSLDERGRIAMHRGGPRYWRAETLQDVARRPGAVYTVAMAARTDAEPPIGWAPFDDQP
ncbi:virulence factor SrfB [Dactylosporangium siamense]|uniref:Molecular chaperone n=1 Tax=Dactylosporangium siamense TaxID=685454 RepID=A0A919PYJ6_9ACTN|nr:virulence factor SrfB [Dactylosporangium siamense]GIG52007.1 hypothetical protein Dsi01nite_100480 [Dactylosporangium siamense]